MELAQQAKCNGATKGYKCPTQEEEENKEVGDQEA